MNWLIGPKLQLLLLSLTVHFYWNAKCFLWHFIFLCWYQLFVLHLLAAKRILSVILTVIHWQRSDRHLGKITESFSYYQLFLGDAIKMIDDKAQPDLSKGFGWILQEICAVFNTHAPELPSKGSCGLYMAILTALQRASTFHSVQWNLLPAQGSLLRFLVLSSIAKVWRGTGKKIEGMEHAEIPEVCCRGREAG